ncbi:hypothetical protein KMT30_30480 [Streptomyces sp. IBSBF 2953]|uniref:hypothetical protein n=1 Tax=Streptomyces TaxID=1883 RepID=UPI002119D552|nr:hypothetical protein [Streptomyces scabiei]MCQ9183297.1 hypothetical protein [Streptomyces hayashii]MDX3117799.1 hypothetical protein [Streptomyces scabiei]
MAGGGQQSSAQSTRNGIQALEAARNGVTRCRQDVDATRGSLSTAYQGSDGGQFGQLLRMWDEQCGVIQKNLQDMVDALELSMKQHQQTQNAAGEAVIRARTAADSAFQQLTGA